MDVLLTHGFFLDQDPLEKQVMKPHPPLGILYISAYLKSKGFAVEVIDNTFSTQKRFYSRLTELRPGLVGLYVNMMTKFEALEIIRRANALGSRVIVGGPDPPYYAEEYLRHGADIVVIGEGEEALEQLIPILSGPSEPADLKEVAGIAFLDEDGNLHHSAARPLIKNLDTLPFPDRESIRVAEYVDTWRSNHGYGPVSLITARGCPYQCTWCSHSVFGRTLRKRSPTSVVDEVDYLVQLYRPDVLWYADDVFNIDRKWLFKYAEILKSRRIKLPFECICRADLLDEEVIQTLSDMGCFRVWIGSESGSQRLLDAMKRGVKAEKVQEMTRLAKRYGIETGMFLMWGFEDENQDDIAQTIEHVKKANPDLLLTTVSYPIRGTEYAERMRERGRIISSGTWSQVSDRALKIRGRHSRRYYDFVNKRMYAEIELSRLGKRNGNTFLRRARARINMYTGKLGMTLTSLQREA